MSKWPMVALSEVISAAGRRAGPDIAPPVYSVTKHSGFVRSDEYFKKQVFSRNLSTYKLVEAGDFAYATIHLDEGSIGISPRDALISPMYTAFRVDRSRVDPSYLLRFLKSSKALSSYSLMGNGGVHRRKSISLANLSKMRVPLPSVGEQRRIAAILDRGRSQSNAHSGLIGTVESVNEAAYLAMFRDSPANAKVQDVAASHKGSIRTGPFGSQLLHSEFIDEGISVLGLDNVVSGRFVHGGGRYISQEKFADLSRFQAYPGDVLISIMGTVGKSVVAPPDLPVSINTKHICAITVNAEWILPEFLEASFRWHPQSRRHLVENTRGAIMAGLNMGVIKSMPIPFPELDIQEEFVERIRLNGRLAGLQTKRDGLSTELDAALQSRAFRGEL